MSAHARSAGIASRAQLRHFVMLKIFNAEPVAKAFTPKEVDTFFARLQAQNPHPKTELQYRNPYTLLVAVVLSAQATDKGVNKATAELFKTVDTPEKMVTLGEKGLTDYIKTIGLYRNKAKNVIALSRDL